MKWTIFFQLVVIFLVLIKSTQGFCTFKTHYTYTAGEELKKIEYTDDNGGDRHSCTLEISPMRNLTNGHFLEISWQKFHLPSDMPDCKDFYIEIFLTRNHRSIGKFCSKNIGGALPFNMYSYDGYAKIYYYVGKNGTKTAFQISYIMKETSNDYVRSPSSCSDHTDYTHYTRTGVFSLDWPNENRFSRLLSCTNRINAGNSKETKIIFMDVDLTKGDPNNYFDGDHLEIRGTNSVSGEFSSSKVVKSRIFSIQSVTTSYKYISIKFYTLVFRDRWINSNKKNSEANRKRGFVAGYLVYDKVTAPWTGPDFKGTTHGTGSNGGSVSYEGKAEGIALSTGTIIAITCAVVAVCLLSTLFGVCKSYRSRQRERNRAAQWSPTAERRTDTQNAITHEQSDSESETSNLTGRATSGTAMEAACRIAVGTVQPSAPTEEDLTAGGRPVVTSVERPPPYTPSPILHHTTTFPQVQVSPDEPPPSYGDVILMQPMGARGGNSETTATTTSQTGVFTLPEQSTDSVNNR